MQGRGLIYLAILLVLGAVVMLQFAYQPETISMAIGQGQRAFREALTGKGETETSFELPKAECADCPVIQKITLFPAQPTIQDSINCTFELDRQVEKADFEYKWMVNGKVLDNIKKDVLPVGSFKKNDRISVDVTPVLSGRKGLMAQGRDIIIYSAPPVLAMKEGLVKGEDVVELQLIGTDPDGDKITYALEEPHLEGMSVDKESGKITWKPSKREKGIYKFGASATDPDGSKIVMVFEVSLDVK
jgi:hypothetical protein